MPKCLDSQKCCESCGVEFDREDLAGGKCASCLAEDWAEEVEERRREGMPTGREPRQSEVMVSGAVGIMRSIDKIVWHGDKMMLQDLDERIERLKQHVDKARELFAEGN